MYRIKHKLKSVQVKIDDNKQRICPYRFRLTGVYTPMTPSVQKKQVPHIAAPAKPVCLFAVIMCLQCTVHRSMVVLPLFWKNITK